jgi:hypothetical protein
MNRSNPDPTAPSQGNILYTGDTFPRPDPTKLTTEQLNREITSLKELLDAQMKDLHRRDESLASDVAKTPDMLIREIDHLRGFIEARLQGMDRATALFLETQSRLPSQTDEKILALRGIHQEKLESIQVQFKERDIRTAQADLNTKAGLDLALKEAKESVHELHSIIETRLSGVDQATVLLQRILDRFPAQVDEKINALRQIHEEKLGSIQVQFRERDVRTEQSSKDSKVAVDAALQAAKEAVGEQNKSSALAIAKSEASTSKQIDQLGSQITAQTKNVDDKFSDLKERLTRVEGQGAGVKEGTHDTEHRQNNSSTLTVAVISAVISAIAVIVMLGMTLMHR